MKKNDYLLIIGIIIVSAIFYIGYQFFYEEAMVVVVSVDGEGYGTYDINEDQEIVINDTNTVVIENNTVYMIDASCPDLLCIHQGVIDEANESIICLPNKVIVTIEGGSSSNGDATVR